MVRSTYSSFHTLSAVDLISRSFWELRESNLGLLDEKREHYLFKLILLQVIAAIHFYFDHFAPSSSFKYC